jgi:hypothetical protein
VERDLGTALPDAYKAFIEYFGPGRFSEEFQYFTPGIESSGYELVHLVRKNHARWRSAPRLAVEGVPPFPEPGGVLRFAWIGDGATAQWRTGAEHPNDWGIVVEHGRMDGDLEFDGDVLDLVAAMLDETPEVDALEYYPQLMAVFVPGDGSVRTGSRLTRLEPISRFAADGAA